MKTRYIFSLFMLTVASLTAFAQSDEALKKIESARIALITERLGLTPAQAEKFWPVYREYVQHRQHLREEYTTARQAVNGKQMTDEESKKILEKGLHLKEQQVELDKNYNEKLNRVISHNQILSLRKAEDDFRKMILRKLDNRREQREQVHRREERKNNE